MTKRKRGYSFANGCLIHGVISVDLWKNWDYNAKPRLYFLSHLHADHTDGLNGSWSRGPIYTSPQNVRLASHLIGCDSSFLVPLRLGVPHKLYLTQNEEGPAVTVTLIDANHVPGAVMFLFEGFFGRTLYTADFRYSPEMMDHPEMSNIDTLYLDNTFFFKDCTFPTREKVLERLITFLRSQPSSTRIYFGLQRLGKEQAVVGIAKALHEKIHVNPERLALFTDMNLPDVFTTNPEDCRMFIVNKTLINRNFLQAENEIRPTIGILLTSLFYNWPGGPYTSSKLYGLHVFEFSDHSSHPELTEFVRRLQPKRVTPIIQSSDCFGILRDRKDFLHKRIDMTPFNRFLCNDPMPKFQAPQFQGQDTWSGFETSRKKVRFVHEVAKRPYRGPKGPVYESTTDDTSLEDISAKPDSSNGNPESETIPNEVTNQQVDAHRSRQPSPDSTNVDQAENSTNGNLMKDNLKNGESASKPIITISALKNPFTAITVEKINASLSESIAAQVKNFPTSTNNLSSIAGSLSKSDSSKSSGKALSNKSAPLVLDQQATLHVSIPLITNESLTSLSDSGEPSQSLLNNDESSLWYNNQNAVPTSSKSICTNEGTSLHEQVEQSLSSGHDSRDKSAALSKSSDTSALLQLPKAKSRSAAAKISSSQMTNDSSSSFENQLLERNCQKNIATKTNSSSEASSTKKLSKSNASLSTSSSFLTNDTTTSSLLKRRNKEDDLATSADVSKISDVQLSKDGQAEDISSSLMTNDTTSSSRMTNDTTSSSRMTIGTTSSSRMTNDTTSSRMTIGTTSSSRNRSYGQSSQDNFATATDSSLDQQTTKKTSNDNSVDVSETSSDYQSLSNATRDMSLITNRSTSSRPTNSNNANSSSRPNDTSSLENNIVTTSSEPSFATNLSKSKPSPTENETTSTSSSKPNRTRIISMEFASNSFRSLQTSSSGSSNVLRVLNQTTSSSNVARSVKNQVPAKGPSDTAQRPIDDSSGISNISSINPVSTSIDRSAETSSDSFYSIISGGEAVENCAPNGQEIIVAQCQLPSINDITNRLIEAKRKVADRESPNSLKDLENVLEVMRQVLDKYEDS